MGHLCHIKPARGGHTHTVIFLHGRDSNCEEFASELFESEASRPADGPRTIPALFPTIRWVFPGAAELHSDRFDTPLSQWFDMWSTENPNERSEIQHSGLKESVVEILKTIRHEEALVPRSKIFLGGISQGFATALATFFADGQGLAGLVGFCSWMPLLGDLELDITGQTASENARQMHSAYFGKHPERVNPSRVFNTDIFLAHAKDDDVVHYQHGMVMKETLTRLGHNVDWHLYEDGGHWINEPQGVDDLVDFLRPRV